MTKAGDEYRELVGNVVRALDTGAKVNTEQWIDGPDGGRDMDVEVRGTRDGQPHFVLIECKDHKRRIGIPFVDAFESKCRDLMPDRRIMFSNSGFTADALHKAERVGIEMASALKAMDDVIHGHMSGEIVARRLTLQLGPCTLVPFEGQSFDFADPWRLADLAFDNLLVSRWVFEKMKEEAHAHDEATRIKFQYSFRDEPRWTYESKPVAVAGFAFEIACAKDWVSQNVRPAVTLGYFDHLRRAVILPDQHLYTLGAIDRSAWKETDKTWGDTQASSGDIRTEITLIRSNLANSPGVTPGVDALVVEHQVDAE